MTINYHPISASNANTGKKKGFSSYVRRVKRHALPSGWRGLVIISIVLTVTVLVLNLICLLWAVSNQQDPLTGARLFARGSCGSIRIGYTILAVIVNILSTLLLAASTACIQVLAAPSRDEISEAHARGKWLCIGVSSLRNFRGVRRICLCTLLALSSLPLHLAYNSVFGHRVFGWKAVILAGSDVFATGPVISVDAQQSFGRKGLTIFSNPDQTLDFIQGFQRDTIAGLTQQLSWEDCVTSVKSGIISTHDTYFLVVNSPNTSSPLAGWTYVDFFQPTEQSLDDSDQELSDWMCSKSDGASSNLDCPSIIDTAGKWQLDLPWLCPVLEDSYGPSLCNRSQYAVSSCFARPAETKCEISLDPVLMAVVITSNAIKILCFTATLFWRPPAAEPLVTIGDAASSFLSEPDLCTAGLGPVSVKDFRKANPRNKTLDSRKAKANHRATHVWIRWSIAVAL